MAAMEDELGLPEEDAAQEELGLEDDEFSLAAVPSVPGFAEGLAEPSGEKEMIKQVSLAEPSREKEMIKQVTGLSNGGESDSQDADAPTSRMGSKESTMKPTMSMQQLMKPTMSMQSSKSEGSMMRSSSHKSQFHVIKAAADEQAKLKGIEALKMKLKAAAMKINAVQTVARSSTDAAATGARSSADAAGVNWSKIFGKYASDGSGEIDFDTFRMAIRKEAKVSAEVLPEPQLRILFNSIDKDGGGTISYKDEFIPWIEKKLVPEKVKLRDVAEDNRTESLNERAKLKRSLSWSKKLDAYKAKMKLARSGIRAASYGGTGGGPKWEQIFRQYDPSYTGEVSFEIFSRALRKDAKISPITLSDQLLRTLFDFCDVDGDGTVSYETEFLPFMENDVESQFERRGLTKGGSGKLKRPCSTSPSSSQAISPTSPQFSGQSFDFTTQISQLSSQVLSQSKDIERIKFENQEELRRLEEDQTRLANLLHSSGTLKQHTLQQALLSPSRTAAAFGNEVNAPASPGLSNTVRSYAPSASRRSQSVPAPSTPFAYHNPDGDDLYELCLPLLHRNTPRRKYDKAFKSVQIAIRNGAIPDIWKGPGIPLLGAVQAGCTDLAVLLIQAQASVNVRSEQGVSPLHIASFHGSVDTCIMLLDNDADPNMPDCHEQTPLFFSPTRQICELLFQRVADISALNLIGQSAFHLSGKAGYADVLLWFMHHLPRAIIDMKDEGGCTALEYAEGANVSPFALNKMRNWDPAMINWDPAFKLIKKQRGLQRPGNELTFDKQNEIRMKLKAAAYWRGGVDWGTLFNKYDRAGHGELIYAEFHEAIREGANVAPSMLSDQGLLALFKLMDTDEGGTLNYEEEFMPWFEGRDQPDEIEEEPQGPSALKAAMMNEVKKRLRAAAYTNGVLSWKALFRYYDKDNSGEITFNEFKGGIRKSCKITRALVSDEAMKELFDYLDKDGGGTVQYEAEFLHWLDPGGGGTDETKMEKADHLKEFETLKKKKEKLHFDSQVIQIKRQLMISSMIGGEVNLRKMFKAYDKAEKWELGFQEFLTMIRKLAKVTPQMLQDFHLKALFKAIDKNRNNVIDYESEFLPWLGVQLGEDEPKDIFTVENALKARHKQAMRMVQKNMKEIKAAMTRAAYHEGHFLWDQLYRECERPAKTEELRGRLDISEFTSLCRKKAKLLEPKYTDEVIQALFDTVDEEDSGLIDLEDDFMPWIEDAG